MKRTGMLMLMLWLAGLGGALKLLAQAAGTNDVVVTARTWTIQRAELDAVMRRAEKERLLAGRLLPDEERQALERKVLEQLVFTRICLARATPADRRRATFESQAFIEGIKREQGSEEAFQRLLARAGFNAETFAREKLNEAVVAAVVDREVKGAIRIPTADALKYYDEHPEKWMDPEQAKAAHILVASSDPKTGQPWPKEELEQREAKARKALDRARAGEAFAALVKELSDDTASRDRGGVYVFSRGQMEPEFEAAAFSMAPGQVSDVVRSPYGWHVIQLQEKRPAQRREFAAVEREIRALLTEKELADRIAEYSRIQHQEQEVKRLVPPSAARQP